MIAGSLFQVDGSGYNPIVWEANGTPVPLGALVTGESSEAKDINREGTIAVGLSGNRAVMWTRESAASPWDPSPVDLDSALGIPASDCTGSGSSRALEINATGIIVGQDCGVPYLWRVAGRTVLSRERLGGLGTKANEVTWATAINEATPATAVGKAAPPGLGDSGVYWDGL
jgi:hypothetical protein